MFPLLQLREQQRQERRLALWQQVRDQLRSCLTRWLPGSRVRLFGSLAHRGRFHDASDIDLAIEALPSGMSLFTLTALLEEEMHRPVDVVLLSESRLRDKILAQSETWTV